MLFVMHKGSYTTYALIYSIRLIAEKGALYLIGFYTSD